jgi:segregation and condensation protein A
VTGAVESPTLTVRVGSFEGPLDLLLHLCRSQEIDLARLPVRAVTDQYLVHLESMQFRDLEVAGAFMVMAATLIYLKSKLLLPAAPEEEDDQLDEEGETLRRELAERLHEYARIKALGRWLAAREAEQALVFGRVDDELPPPEDVPLADLSVHMLVQALNRLIEALRVRAPREVEAEPVSVLERMSEILELLRHTWSLLFSAVAGAERIRAEWVVTLLALLELARLGQARARQSELFGEIVIEGSALPVHPLRPPAAGEDPRTEQPAGLRSTDAGEGAVNDA